MERITYRKTLDVHKNGVQFMLQGFETADKLSRVIEISLMASGDAIDFPLENLTAMMYVNTPSATEPSINQCTIKDNKVVYDVLPILEEGITTMQLKLIETSKDGAKSVLASPKFGVEVTNSNTNDDGPELKANFSAIEHFIAKADVAYASRLERIELTSDCLFKAYYADGNTYETDILQKLFLNGNVLLSESYAHGGTGVRTGEDTDNSKYYSDVSKSESLLAKDIMANSENILEEVKLHGMYTAFSVDFATGEVEYVSPSFSFKINKETGHLETEGQSYTFDEEVGRVMTEWLAKNGVVISDLQDISSTHEEAIATLNSTTETQREDIDVTKEDITTLQKSIDDLHILLSPTLLWANPNPENEFEPQEITLDLSEYKRFVIIYADGNKTQRLCEQTITEKGSENIMRRWTASAAEYWRRVTITDSGVSFTECKVSSGTLHNEMFIPMKIYGYKY